MFYNIELDIRLKVKSISCVIKSGYVNFLWEIFLG